MSSLGWRLGGLRLGFGVGFFGMIPARHVGDRWTSSRDFELYHYRNFRLFGSTPWGRR